jgi:DNA-binding response OmpR family regulator
MKTDVPLRTVMIVDDEIVFRKRYRRVLAAEGFRILEAPNALEVANLLMRKKSSIDLILLDINIPEIDGRGIFEIIDEYAPNLAIIVTSVHPLNDQKLRIPRAADYFNKSQKDDVLLKKVRNILGVEAHKV